MSRTDAVPAKEKKVGYLELIYDLIFVFIIGRNNSLLRENMALNIAVTAVFVYGVFTLLWLHGRKVAGSNRRNKKPADAVRRLGARKAFASGLYFFSNAAATSPSSLRMGRCCGHTFSHLPQRMQSEALPCPSPVTALS